ncbi:MAG: hypothetical protein ABIN80_20290 [Dyadobacter sp.]|uniref:hypothetical protein n=1 Tax=Dyadobacter sp. TaxID=1914288 RepID=UPI003265A69A
MKIESIIPEFFHAAYHRYSLLETDEEKAKFWHELAIENADIAPEIIEQQWLKGVLLLSEHVDKLHLKVKAQLTV